MKLFYSIEGVQSVIEQSDFVVDFIKYLKNTSTESTHSSNAFGTAGTDGRSAYDTLQGTESDAGYQFKLDRYDGSVFQDMLSIFISLTKNKYDVNFQNFNKYVHPDLHKYIEQSKESLNLTEGQVSYNSLSRRYGTLVTNAETSQELGLKRYFERSPREQHGMFKSVELDSTKLGHNEVDSLGRNPGAAPK